MERWASDSDIQTWSLTSLYKMGAAVSHNLEIAQCGSISAVARAMRVHHQHASIQVASCAVLCQLVLSGSAPTIPQIKALVLSEPDLLPLLFAARNQHYVSQVLMSVSTLLLDHLELLLAGGTAYVFRHNPRPFPTLTELSACAVAKMRHETHGTHTSAPLMDLILEDIVALVESGKKCNAEGCSVWCARPHYVATRTRHGAWELFSVCSLSCMAKVGGPEVVAGQNLA